MTQINLKLIFYSFFTRNFAKPGRRRSAVAKTIIKFPSICKSRAFLNLDNFKDLRIFPLSLKK